jgi:hypothetical protein
MEKPVLEAAHIVPEIVAGGSVFPHVTVIEGALVREATIPPHAPGTMGTIAFTAIQPRVSRTVRDFDFSFVDA